MKAKFESFLSQLETVENKSTIDTIRKGFEAVTEGYGDLREATVPAIDSFNQMATNAANNMGNSVLNFLDNSSAQREHMFSIDEEPELDGNPTSVFNQYEEFEPERDEIEDDLGLTAGQY